MAPTLPVRIAIRFANQAMISRVASRFAAKKKQSEGPPPDLVKEMKGAISKMEGALKSKTGLKFESLGDSVWDDGLMSLTFQGPTKKGVRSPVPMEVNGRFVVHAQYVTSDNSVDITVSYLEWVKDRLNVSNPDEEQERGVALDKAGDVALKLLGESAAKAKAKMKKK